MEIIENVVQIPELESIEERKKKLKYFLNRKESVREVAKVTGTICYQTKVITAEEAVLVAQLLGLSPEFAIERFCGNKCWMMIKNRNKVKTEKTRQSLKEGKKRQEARKVSAKRKKTR